MAGEEQDLSEDTDIAFQNRRSSSPFAWPLR